MPMIGPLYTVVALLLMAVGFLIVLWRRNLIKIILGFGIADTGLHLFMVSLGFVPGGTAPIIDKESMFENLGDLIVPPGAVVDPVVQALVLTSIVIGVGVTAIGLSYVIRLYSKTQTLDVKAHGKLRW